MLIRETSIHLYASKESSASYGSFWNSWKQADLRRGRPSLLWEIKDFSEDGKDPLTSCSGLQRNEGLSDDARCCKSMPRLSLLDKKLTFFFS